MTRLLLAGLLALWTATSFVCGQNPSLFVEPAEAHHLVQNGSSLKIACYTKDDQNVSLKWKGEDLDGKGITQSENVANGWQFCNLTIDNYEDKMAGVYTCELKMKNNEGPTTFPIEIHTLKKQSEDVMFYRENKTLNLSCKVEVPGATVQGPTWKLGEMLVEDVETRGSSMKPTGETLTIDGVMRSDANEYNAQFEIEYPNEEEVFKYDCLVALKADPLVKDFDKSKNLIQEDNLELQCDVLGYPLPVVSWFKDNEPIFSKLDRITMEPNKGVINGTLKIKKVDYDDAGEYKCLAFTESLKSNSSKTITVRVKDKFAALWPFLGIVAEVVVLCAIIFIYEKRRSRLAEQEEATQDEPDGATNDRSEGLRHRNTNASNPRA